MNVPNTLSAIRLLLIPAFCVAFLSGPDYYIWAALALALSGLSDLFDGYFARKLNQITELGKWLDPIADKLTLGAVVVCMWIVYHESYPMLTPLFCILIAKEFMMAVGGLIVTHGRTEMIPSQWWGTVGTMIFYVCMLCIVLLSVFGGDNVSPVIMTVLVALPAAAMLFAFIKYLIFGIKIMREKQPEGANDENVTEQVG